MRRLRLQQLIRYAVVTLAVLSVYYLLKSDKSIQKKSIDDNDEHLVKVEKKINSIGDVQARETKKIEHLVSNSV